MLSTTTIGLWLGLAAAALAGPAEGPPRNAGEDSQRWVDEVLSFGAAPAGPRLALLRQDHEQLEFNRSVIGTPMTIADRVFQDGLGTHSISEIAVRSPQPIRRFMAEVGVDANPRTAAGQGSVVFVVKTAGGELFRSPVMRGGQPAIAVDVAVDAAELELHVENAGDGPACDHADWAEARISLDGRTWLRLCDLPLEGRPEVRRTLPFSFAYEGLSSDGLLTKWAVTRASPSPGRTIRTWTDPAGRLKVTCEVTHAEGYPAADWVLWFENVGAKDTGLIENVQALDLVLNSPLSGASPYRLYETKGGPASPADFEPSVVGVSRKEPRSMDAGHGRSSSKNFPFFKVETGRGSVIVTVGWSGMWKADLSCPEDRLLHMTAGLERTRFVLHPGERVRSPRILTLFWAGDTWDANARFRELIHRDYAAKRGGQAPLPIPFCNTCFTRGGGWLNECTAENQISLINAYAAVGLEALLTDAGWFEGGWPAGAGNWTPRKDAYPEGMAPVAAAAKAKGMIYGLWYEPERVVRGTWLHRERPEWLLHSQAGEQDTYLLNFGLPEVREYFFNIVRDFMTLPGFRVYRQDFNMDPLPYWRFSDAPDRVGITEMKYIEGLYSYWDALAAAWPDSLREECASGGNRIDLETVRRMHLHQKTDYWFDNEADQAALWGLSQYLPNNSVVAHLNRMDDYSFHSTMASSLCLGWIADADNFDQARGRALLARYHAVKHLLVGAWYPVLGYSRGPADWTGSQYHRADLSEGLILVFRHAQSPYTQVELRLRGLEAERRYVVRSDRAGPLGVFTGRELAEGLAVSLPKRHSSDLITYQKAGG